jgi:RNA polymerase sigma-70 factor, ECF subfamily
MIADTVQSTNLFRSSEIDLLEGKDLRRPDVFAGLYRQFYDDIFRYCVHRLFDRSTAEDITSEVFFKAVEHIEDFKGTEIQFRNWLYTIATNAINNHIRKKVRRDALTSIFVQKAAYNYEDCKSGEKIPEERLVLLQKAIFELKPKYQTIITLRFFENLKLTEIAEVLSSRPSTVRSQLARALAKLRKKLGPVWREV